MTTGFIALSIVLVFSMVKSVAGRSPRHDRRRFMDDPAVVSTVALSRTFDREKDGEALRSLLMSPVPRSAIYAGKTFATTAIMGFIQILVLVLAGLFISERLWTEIGTVALLMLEGTLGYAGLGTVLAAALMRTRGREALLTAVLFPLMFPVLILGTVGCTHALDATSVGDGADKLIELLVIDTVFISRGLGI